MVEPWIYARKKRNLMKQCKKPKMRMVNEREVATHHKKEKGIFYNTQREEKSHHITLRKGDEKKKLNSKSISCFFDRGGSFALTRWEVVPCVGGHSQTKAKAKRTQREACRVVGPAQSPYGRAYVGPGYHAD